jgi:hypothetical protein
MVPVILAVPLGPGAVATSAAGSSAGVPPAGASPPPPQLVVARIRAELSTVKMIVQFRFITFWYLLVLSESFLGNLHISLGKVPEKRKIFEKLGEKIFVPLS